MVEEDMKSEYIDFKPFIQLLTDSTTHDKNQSVCILQAGACDYVLLVGQVRPAFSPILIPLKYYLRFVNHADGLTYCLQVSTHVQTLSDNGQRYNPNHHK